MSHVSTNQAYKKHNGYLSKDSGCVVDLSIRWYATGEVPSKDSGLVLVSVSITWYATSGGALRA